MVHPTTGLHSQVNTRWPIYSKAYTTYNFKLKDKHEFKVMAGMDAEKG